MKKQFLILFIQLLVSSIVFSQLPDTEIFLSSITKSDSTLVFSTPVNITEHEGYDNQPWFTPDGKRILYVSIEDSTQSDIYAYDLTAGVRIQQTNTPESEYSPAYSPDNRFLSVVRVDADSGQRFYYMPLSNLRRSAVVYNSDSIGYACILNDSMLAMFILGRANTLQLLNMKNGDRKLIASDIGRCLKLSPDGSKLYFIIKGNPAEWFIYSMNVKDHKLERVIQTLPGCEDFALMPDSKILMGREGKLYYSEDRKEWKFLTDFSATTGDFYRIAINSEGTLVAVVAFKGKKP